MRNPSLDKPDRIPASRRRAGLVWVAIVALFCNALLPAAVATGVGFLGTGRDALALVLCGAISGHDLPGKARPAPFVHHCALCAAAPAALPPPRHAGLTLPRAVAGEAPRLFRTAALPALSRHCRAQPRAPPVAA